MGFWRPRPHWIASGFGDHGKILLLPPPTESRRLGTSHERGRPLRKILDLRLVPTCKSTHTCTRTHTHAHTHPAVYDSPAGRTDHTSWAGQRRRPESRICRQTCQGTRNLDLCPGDPCPLTTLGGDNAPGKNLCIVCWSLTEHRSTESTAPSHCHSTVPNSPATDHTHSHHRHNSKLFYNKPSPESNHPTNLPCKYLQYKLIWKF